ncbi:C6 zinc finger domain protein [Colletotrichum tofieldiae]|nr:C6 zinc finger domain protein [Colletotrichum tofieldiae]
MPPLVPPTRRSRNGCIDCRKAKVKCDEIRPSCGTCARRRLVCQGYKTQATQHCQRLPSSLVDLAGASNGSVVIIEVFGGPFEDRVRQSWRRFPTAPGEGEKRSALALDTRTFSLLPPGTIPVADQPHIELYFNRHPFELLIGPEFVTEMNANVLMMMHQDPIVIADTISAIGYSYEVGNSLGALLPVLDRRAKMLANLRNMKPSSYYFEEALFLLLGLCAMEACVKSRA